MFTGFCLFGNWGSLGTFGVGGWIGLALSLVFWLGLIAGLALLVVWALRRARVSTTTVSYVGGQAASGGQNTALGILQAQYAQGGITREQFNLRNQNIR